MFYKKTVTFTYFSCRSAEDKLKSLTASGRQLTDTVTIYAGLAIELQFI